MFDPLNAAPDVNSPRLSAKESRLFEELQSSSPDLARSFLSKVPAARRAGLHRLLQGFLMEGLLPPAAWRDGVLTVTLPSGSSSHATLHYSYSRRYLSGRFDASEGAELYLSRDGSTEIVESPSRLLEILEESELSPEGSESARFRREVENSAAHHALSLVGAEERRRELADRAREFGVSSASTLARRLYEEDYEENYGGFLRKSPGLLAFFEQLVSEGHPFHPCAKLKSGLTAGDAARYSPEWGACLEVALIALRREVCRESSPDGDGFGEVLFAEHPGTKRDFEEALLGRDLAPPSFVPVPVHPWQVENTLPRLYSEALSRGDIVPLHEARLAARPLVSFRSLAPVSGGPHIKCAVDLRLTNAVRTVSPASVENAAELTRLLRRIRRLEKTGKTGKDPGGDSGGRFVVLEERAGVYYDPSPGEAGEWSEASRNLAAILREDPESHVRAGEVALPASALLAESPLGGAVLVELVEEFAGLYGIRCVEEASVPFFRRYCEVCLPGFLTMMSRYGIGLEGHLQNSIPVFRGGEPARMLVRDFGGVRILRPRLRARGLDVDLHPESEIEAENAEDLRSKVFYPLFLNHLGEVVACLSRNLDLGEARYWREAAEVCRETYGSPRLDGETREGSEADERALFSPTMRLKALTTMRLLGNVTDYAYAEVPNPLALAERA